MEASNSKVSFLSETEYELLRNVLTRRNPRLLEHIIVPGSLSEEDVEALALVLNGEEFCANLDENWDPTAYALRVEKLGDDIKARWLESSK
ncbi:hypothetical protein NJBCHELONAE_48190 [Mycobacteroides chelonae]|nr:hypothetical protein NJBCHELONAE_48190 [Mycobacteroides chelonae]